MTAKVKPPKNNQEWARNVETKQEQDENATSARVGPWVLSSQIDTENLLASHVDGGSVVLAEKPDSGDEPDAVASNDPPYIKVERQTTQSGPRGSTVLVSWNSVDFQSGFGFVAPGTDLVIPADGVYAIDYTLYMLNASTVTNKAILLIGGVPKLTGAVLSTESSIYPGFSLSSTFNLSAGTVIQGGAWVSGSGTMDFGYSGDDPTVFTSLSLARLPIG